MLMSSGLTPGIGATTMSSRSFWNRLTGIAVASVIGVVLPAAGSVTILLREWDQPAVPILTSLPRTTEAHRGPIDDDPRRVPRIASGRRARRRDGAGRGAGPGLPRPGAGALGGTDVGRDPPAHHRLRLDGPAAAQRRGRRVVRRGARGAE